MKTSARANLAGFSIQAVSAMLAAFVVYDRKVAFAAEDAKDAEEEKATFATDRR